jgi:hypothetical protein
MQGCFLGCCIGGLNASKPYGQERSQRQLISWPYAIWTLDSKSLWPLDGSMCVSGDCAAHYGSQYKEDGNAGVSGMSKRALYII